MNPLDLVDVLRDVALHPQPRPLLRPSAAPARVAVEVLGPAGAVRAATEAAAEGRRAGHAEGFAQGRDEGRASAMAELARETQSRVAQALEAASERSTTEAAARQAEAQQRTEALIARWANAVEAFETGAAERLDALESDAIALAFEAVCRIVGERSGCAELVEGAVRTAIGSLRAGTLLRVRLNPADFPLLAPTGAAPDLAGDAAVEWIADHGVDSGGCILDTVQGSLDARMETQLVRLRQLWLDVAHQPDSTPSAEAPA